MNYIIHSGPHFRLGWVFPLWRNSQWRRCESSPDRHQYRLHGIWVCYSGVDNVWSCAERPPLSSPDHWNCILRSSVRGPQCLSVLQRLENLHFWPDRFRMVQVHGLHHWEWGSYEPFWQQNETRYWGRLSSDSHCWNLWWQLLHWTRLGSFRRMAPSRAVMASNRRTVSVHQRLHG